MVWWNVRKEGRGFGVPFFAPQDVLAGTSRLAMLDGVVDVFLVLPLQLSDPPRCCCLRVRTTFRGSADESSQGQDPEEDGEELHAGVPGGCTLRSILEAAPASLFISFSLCSLPRVCQPLVHTYHPNSAKVHEDLQCMILCSRSWQEYPLALQHMAILLRSAHQPGNSVSGSELEAVLMEGL